MPMSNLYLIYFHVTNTRGNLYSVTKCSFRTYSLYVFFGHKFGDPSLNGSWVNARTSKWLIHTRTHIQMQATTVPEGQNWLGPNELNQNDQTVICLRSLHKMLSLCRQRQEICRLRWTPHPAVVFRRVNMTCVTAVCSCDDTCQIWTWCSTGNQSFDNSQKAQKITARRELVLVSPLNIRQR